MICLDTTHVHTTLPVNIPQMAQNRTGLGLPKVRYGICVQGYISTGIDRR